METRITQYNSYKKNTMKSQIVIYQAENGKTKLDVRLDNETVWLTQKQMAELFQTTIPNINMHLKSIYEECELDEISTIKDFLIVQLEGNRNVERTQKFYNFRTPEPITRIKELGELPLKEQLSKLPRKGDISKRSEKSHKSLPPRNLRFFAALQNDTQKFIINVVKH